MRVSGCGVTTFAVDPGATCTAGAVTAMSAGACALDEADTPATPSEGTAPGPGSGAGGRGTELTARARTAILRVTDAFSRRSPLTSSARTDNVAAVALTGAVKRIRTCRA